MPHLVAMDGVGRVCGAREEVGEVLIGVRADAERVGEGDGGEDDLLVQILPVELFWWG